MTVKQRQARARFKKVVQEASKLRKKNKKLTQAQAVKQAWAIQYSKEGKSRVGKVQKTSVKAKRSKKSGEMHTDTKSHNVNIRVVSGNINTDLNKTVKQYKNLLQQIKEAEKIYKKAKDITIKFYAKQKLDKLKYELRERKFVANNIVKELKKIK